MANKIDHLIPTLVGPEQYGFVRGCRMSTASSAAFSCIQQIKKKGQGILLCLDIRKAFDSIFHDLMEIMMKKIFVNSKFADQWMQWTNRGRGHVSISDKVSDTFELKKGVGQGDSSSSSKYILMHCVFIAALTSPKMQDRNFEVIQKDYKNLFAKYIHIPSLIQDSPLEQLWKQNDIQNSKYYISHLSDVLRFLVV